MNVSIGRMMIVWRLTFLLFLVVSRLGEGVLGGRCATVG